MHKMVNGQRVDLTAEEIAERQAEEAAWAADAPARKAEEKRRQLAATDAHMARVIEDIYNVLTAEQKAALPQAAKDKIAERQALRAQL